MVESASSMNTDQLAPDSPIPPCEKCGDGPAVQRTVDTMTGFYCRCAKCGHIWHHSPPARADDQPSDER